MITENIMAHFISMRYLLITKSLASLNLGNLEQTSLEEQKIKSPKKFN
jgi:hypothetical protein